MCDPVTAVIDKWKVAETKQQMSSERLAQMVAMFKALDERGQKTVMEAVITQFKIIKGE